MTYYNMNCKNITSDNGEIKAKCLCKDCRKTRTFWKSENLNKKPDLSRDSEMKRRDNIHSNKNIW